MIQESNKRQRGFAIYKDHKIEGKIIEEYYDMIVIYPDNETGSMDETVWIFNKNEVTFE